MKKYVNDNSSTPGGIVTSKLREVEFPVDPPRYVVILLLADTLTGPTSLLVVVNVPDTCPVDRTTPFVKKVGFTSVTNAEWFATLPNPEAENVPILVGQPCDCMLLTNASKPSPSIAATACAAVTCVDAAPTYCIVIVGTSVSTRQSAIKCIKIRFDVFFIVKSSRFVKY